MARVRVRNACVESTLRVMSGLRCAVYAVLRCAVLCSDVLLVQVHVLIGVHVHVCVQTHRFDACLLTLLTLTPFLLPLLFASTLSLRQS